MKKPLLSVRMANAVPCNVLFFVHGKGEKGDPFTVFHIKIDVPDKSCDQKYRWHK
jgi:hypothetical protein